MPDELRRVAQSLEDSVTAERADRAYPPIRERRVTLGLLLLVLPLGTVGLAVMPAGTSRLLLGECFVLALIGVGWVADDWRYRHARDRHRRRRQP